MEQRASLEWEEDGQKISRNGEQAVSFNSSPTRVGWGGSEQQGLPRGGVERPLAGSWAASEATSGEEDHKGLGSLKRI